MLTVTFGSADAWDRNNPFEYLVWLYTDFSSDLNPNQVKCLLYDYEPYSKLWSLKITFWTACTRLTAHRADGTHFNVRIFRVFIVCLCSHQTPSWPESEWSRRWTARCTAVTGETRPTVYINFLFALLLRMANKPLLLPQQPVWQTLLVRFLSLTHWIQTDIFYWTEGY